MSVEVVVVYGRGLAAVHSRDVVNGTPVVRYLDHGNPPGGGPDYRVSGRWTSAKNTRTLTSDEAFEAITRERHEAAARVEACNHPGCWCLTVRNQSNA
jgi:hypothetical protein